MHQTAVIVIGTALILGLALWAALQILDRIDRARRRQQVAEKEASAYCNSCVRCPDSTIILVRHPISERPAPLENDRIPDFLRKQPLPEDDTPTVLHRMLGYRPKRRRN